MLVWVAFIVVCAGPEVTQCSPAVFGETFARVEECQAEIVSMSSEFEARGLTAYGTCAEVKVALTLL